jgi:hypothetical protein
MRMDFGKRHYFSVITFTLALLLGATLLFKGSFGRTYLFVIDAGLFVLSFFFLWDAFLLDWERAKKTAAWTTVTYLPILWALCEICRKWG